MKDTKRISIALRRDELAEVQRKREAIKRRQGLDVSLSAALASLVRAGLAKND